MKITIQGETITTRDNSITMQETAVITITNREYVWEEITSSIFYAIESNLRGYMDESTNTEKRKKETKRI